MATISKETAEVLAANEGRWPGGGEGPDNAQALAVFRYKAVWNEEPVCVVVYFADDLERYEQEGEIVEYLWRR